MLNASSCSKIQTNKSFMNLNLVTLCDCRILPQKTNEPLALLGLVDGSHLRTDDNSVGEDVTKCHRDDIFHYLLGKFRMVVVCSHIGTMPAKTD